MEKETKRYLIIGTAIVVSVGIGVVLWKKYQSSNSADAAATDQSNQDELALLESSLEANAYGGQSGAASYSPAVVGTGTPTSLASEVLALEQALGFGPSPSIPPSSTPTAPSSPTTSTTPPATGSPTPTPANSPTETAGTSPITVNESQADFSLSDLIRYKHGAPIFETDGVPGEGITVS